MIKSIALDAVCAYLRIAVTLIFLAGGFVLLVCVLINIAVRWRVKMSTPNFGSVSQRWLIVHRTEDQ